MRHGNNALRLLAIMGAVLTASAAAHAQGTAPPAGITALEVRPHAGAASIDVSGRAPSGSALTVTLLATYSRDIPDVVMHRTPVVTDASGAYAATVPLAPGYFPGSIVTVYVSSNAGGPAAKAQFIPDAPNRGVVVPLEQVPRSVR